MLPRTSTPNKEGARTKRQQKSEGDGDEGKGLVLVKSNSNDNRSIRVGVEGRRKKEGQRGKRQRHWQGLERGVAEQKNKKTIKLLTHQGYTGFWKCNS